MAMSRLRRTLATLATVPLAAAVSVAAATAPAYAATGCGSQVDAYAGPFVVADNVSCLTLSGSSIDAYAAYAPAYEPGEWSSCTFHVSLRDDTAATTYPAGVSTTACGSSALVHGFFYSPTSGHSYHVYSWVTGTWDGISVVYTVGNSPEYTA